jgi:hypothetical protein
MGNEDGVEECAAETASRGLNENPLDGPPLVVAALESGAEVKEKDGLGVEPPKEKPVEGAVVLDEDWPKVKDGVAEAPADALILLPKLKAPEEGWDNPEAAGDPDEPNEKLKGLLLEASGVLEGGFAPPNDNCGAEPPGPNLPNLAGVDGDSSVADGVKLLLGVEDWSGPLGAKEKREDFFVSAACDAGADEGFAPNKNAGAFEGSPGAPLSAIASWTSLVTSSEEAFRLSGFERVVGATEASLCLADDSSWGAAPKLNANGDFEVEAVAVVVGTKPVPGLLVVEADDFRRVKVPTGGGAGIFRAAWPFTTGAAELTEGWDASGASGLQPALLASLSRYSVYCLARLGRTSARLIIGSCSMTPLRRVIIELFRPRIAR